MLANNEKPFNGQKFIDRCRPWRLAWWGRRREVNEEAAKRKGTDMLRKMRWYSAKTKRVGEFKLYPGSLLPGALYPHIERRIVWRWMVDNRLENATLSISKQMPIEGLILPYSTREEGVAYDSSDHIAQPQECYQYKLRQSWLDENIVDDSEAHPERYNWATTLGEEDLNVNKKIRKSLRSGERKPQTNHELMLWHKTPEKNEDRQDRYRPLDRCLEIEQKQRDKSIRRLVFERPRTKFDRHYGRDLKNDDDVGSQGLKYLYPFYEYALPNPEPKKKKGQREMRRMGEQAVKLCLVDVNAHAPLLFGSLKPKYMRSYAGKYKEIEMKGGIDSDRSDENVTPEALKFLEELRDNQPAPGVKLTEAEVNEMDSFKNYTIDDITDFAVRFPNMKDEIKAAKDNYRSETKKRSRPDSMDEETFTKCGILLYLLKSNLGKPQTLCDIVDELLKPIKEARQPKERFSRINYTDETYPLAPDVNPATTNDSEVQQRNIQVVFFPTLPSVVTSKDVNATPFLNCKQMYAYDLDGLQREVDEDLKNRIPPIWKAGMLRSSGRSQGELSRGIYPLMIENDEFQREVKHYKEEKQRFEENIQRMRQQLLDYQRKSEAYESYYKWYIDLENAEDQTYITVPDKELEVKRLKIKYSDDFSELLFDDGVRLPTKKDDQGNNVPFQTEDFLMACGREDLEVPYNASSWALRPEPNEAQKRFLREKGKDPNYFYNWSEYIKSGEVTPGELIENWDSFKDGVQDYAHVYVYPPVKPLLSLETELTEPKPPSIGEQTFKTSVSGNTHQVYKGIDSTILEDPTFMYAVKHLDAVNALTKKQQAFIIPYAMYDKEEYEACKEREDFKQVLANWESAEQDLAQQRLIEKARLEQKREEKRKKQEEKLKTKNEKERAEEEANEKIRNLMQPVQDSLVCWREKWASETGKETVASYFLDSYGSPMLVPKLNSEGLFSNVPAQNVQPEVWCEAWIKGGTDVNPFQYMPRTKVFNVTIAGKTYTVNKMNGLNRQDGIRFETELQYKKRLKDYNEESNELLKLPWEPERHEPSFRLIAHLAGLYNNIDVNQTEMRLIQDGIDLKGARPSERDYEYKQRVQMWESQLSAAKDVNRGRAFYQRIKDDQALRERLEEQERDREERHRRERETREAAPPRQPSPPPRPQSADPGPSRVPENTDSEDMEERQMGSPISSDDEEDDYKRDQALANRLFGEDRDSVMFDAAQIERLRWHVIGDIASYQTKQEKVDHLAEVVSRFSDRTFFASAASLPPEDRFVLERLRAERKQAR